MKLIVDLKDIKVDIFNILGVNDENAQLFKTNLNTDLTATNDKFIFNYEDETLTPIIEHLVDKLIYISNLNYKLSKRDIIYLINMAKENNLDKVLELYEKETVICQSSNLKKFTPKTLNQLQYYKALVKYPLVFGIGPAGTGKTFIAVAYAIHLLKKGIIKKIIITRPLVEAGESLGFLPGDMKEKVDPYLIPIYDSFSLILGPEALDSLLEKQIVEIAPLAYMRGRTLDNAFVILDEAQNTTKSQMKMFLTRLGFNSKMVITGDISQIDLPNKQKSGLVESIEILKNVGDLKIINFTKVDVIRHPLVQKIIERYEENDSRNI